MNRSVCSRRSRAICATARCINCSIRLLPIYRWCTLQDATQPIINVLRSWISPTPVSLEHKLCWECHTLLQQVPDDESAHEPQYGHKNVCYVCGISTLRRARTHPVPPEGPERDVILALMFPHLAPLLTKVCYACWRVAKHNVQRQMQQDSTSPHIRFSKEEEIDVTESSILLPPPLLQNMIPQRRGPDVDHLQCNNTSQACRICQCNEPSKKICDLKSEESNETGAEIVLFCLSIQVDDSLTTCDELCSQCYEKIISFFNFKHFALKNNTLENDFKSHEVFLSYSNNHESPVWSETEIKSEPEIEVEAECSQSDDELLSDIKKIKYEFIPETSETKDNVKILIEMENLKTNSDLYALLKTTMKDRASSLARILELFSHTLSSDKQRQLRKKINNFIDTVRRKKRQCHYNENQFLVKNVDWLSQSVDWSQFCSPPNPSNLPSSSSTTPQKHFLELSDRQKRRRTDYLKKSPQEHIDYSPRASKNLIDSNAKFIFDFIQNHPEYNEAIKSFCESLLSNETS